MNSKVKFEVSQFSIKAKSKKTKQEINWAKLLEGHNQQTYLQFIVDIFDKEEYLTDDSSKRAFTAHNANTNPEKTIQPGKKGDSIIGFLNGGVYGRIRTKADLAKKSKSEKIGNRDVIGDDFYFLIYLPAQSNNGILIFQSFSDSSIKQSVIKKITSLFETDLFKIAHKPLLPSHYKKSLENGFIIKDVVFNDIFTLKDDNGNDDVETTMQQYIVQVKFKPIKDDAIRGVQKASKWISNFKDIIVGDKKLIDFSKSEVSLQNEGPIKGGKIDIELDSGKLKPTTVFYFNDLDLDENGNLDINKVIAKSEEILEYAIKDVYKM